MFASSVLNLAELVALRPDLANLEKVIYFHENQLIYPVQKHSTRNKLQVENKEQRDFQYGYNQILTRYFISNSNIFQKIVYFDKCKMVILLYIIKALLPIKFYSTRISTKVHSWQI